MECKDIELLLVDYLEGSLEQERRDAVEKHLSGCVDCNKALNEINQVSELIQNSGEELPGSGLQMRFENQLQEEIKKLTNKKQKNSGISILKFSRFPYNIAASILLFVCGLAFGYFLRSTKGNQHQSSEIAELKTEVREMKEAVMFSMLDDESASERIKAVGYVEEMKRPDQKVLDALLNTINRDENVNVRLAALYSVAKFSHMQMIKDSLVISLPLQKDPIIQIVMINMLTEQKETRAKKAIHDILNNQNTMEQVKEVAKKGLRYL